MKPISPLIHGYLDYFTVVIFLAAPSIFDLAGTAAFLSYALAVIHLAMTLITDFPLGAVKVVPFMVHGMVERIVGPVLVLLPFVLGFESYARFFYLFMGIIIIIVGFMTEYEQSRQADQ